MEIYKDDRSSYERAKKKANEIRAFYINLMCYCIVIPALATINIIYSPEFYWFLFSAVGWGIGLTFHGFGAFGTFPFFGKEWEQRKINELLKKEQTNSNNGKSTD